MRILIVLSTVLIAACAAPGPKWYGYEVHYPSRIDTVYIEMFSPKILTVEGEVFVWDTWERKSYLRGIAPITIFDVRETPPKPLLDEW